MHYSILTTYYINPPEVGLNTSRTLPRSNLKVESDKSSKVNL